MLEQTNHSVCPILAWGNSINYFTCSPNNSKATIAYHEFHNESVKNFEFTPDFIQKISNIFSKLHSTLEAALISFNDDFDQKEVIRVKIPKLEKYNKYRDLIIRTHLEEFIVLIEEQEEQTGVDLQMIRVILTYLWEVHTKEPDVYFNPPKVEMTYKWLMTKLVKVLPVSEKKLQDKLIDVFRFGDLEELLVVIDNLILQNKLAKGENILYLQLMDLLHTKMRIFNCGKILGREKLSSREQIQYLSNGTQEAKNKYQNYKTLFPRSEGLKIIEVLTGDLEAIEKIANKDWKVYLMMTIAHSSSTVSSSQLFNTARQFIAKMKINLTKIQKLQLLLLHSDFYQAFKFTSQYIPEPLISTISLIAYELRRFDDATFVSMTGTTHKQSIYISLTNWMNESIVPWETKYPYIDQFVKTFRYNEKAYTDIVNKILQGVEEFAPIKTKSDYAKVVSYSRNVENLGLSVKRERYYLRNLIFHQISNNAFEYLFQLIKLYLDKSGDVGLFAEILSVVLRHIQSDQIDYRLFVKTILSLESSHFPNSFKEKIVEVFYPICILYEAESTPDIGKSKQILLYLLQNQCRNQILLPVIRLLFLLVEKHGASNLQQIYFRLKTICYDIQLNNPELLNNCKEFLDSLSRLFEF